MTLTAHQMTGLARSVKLTLTWSDGVVLRWALAGHIPPDLQSMPQLLGAADLVLDGGGFSRWAVRVPTDKPIRLSDGTLYTSLAALLQTGTRDPRLTACTCTAEEYALSGDLSTLTTKLSGQVVAITDYGPLAATFEVEQRAELEPCDVPHYKVQDTWWATKSERDRVPEESKGVALPLALGPHVPWASFGNKTVAQVRGLGDFGLRPCVSPTVPLERSGEYCYYAFQEFLQGTPYGVYLPSPAQNRGKEVYIQVPEADAYAKLYAGNQSDVWDGYQAPWPGKGYAYRIKLRKQPWVRLPLVPRAPHSWTSAEVTDPEFAFDGKYDTFATVPAGKYLLAELPRITAPGRVSTNSQDNGGGTYDGEFEPNCPAGFQVGIILYLPPSSAGSGSGTVRFGVAFPSSPATPVWLFGSDGYKDIVPPTVAGYLRDDYKSLPYYRAPGDPGDRCWGGTKFHSLDLTTGPDSTGPDNTLWDSSTDGLALPFHLRVENNCAGPVYVLALCLRVGLRLSMAPYQPRMRQTYRGHRKNQYGRNSEWEPESTSGAELASQLAGQLSIAQWAEKVGPKVREEKVAVSPVCVSTDSFQDTVLGSFTGTPSILLSTPVHWLRFILGQYGGLAPARFAADGTLGGWDRARTALAAWAGYAGGTDWVEDFDFLTQGDAEQALEQIRAHLPPVLVRRGPGGDWRCHVWGINPPDAIEQYGRALDWDEVRAPGGAPPDFRLWTGDRTSIFNCVEVAYDADPLTRKTTRTATADPEGSSDGYGANWPGLPGSGLAIADLCAWSRDRYGRRRMPTIQAPGVHDPHVAVAIGMAALFRVYRPAVYLGGSFLSTLWDIQPGMAFQLGSTFQTRGGIAPPFWGSTPWSSLWWRCTEAEQRHEANGLSNYALKAEWQPTSVGGELVGFVGGSADMMEILL